MSAPPTIAVADPATLPSDAFGAWTTQPAWAPPEDAAVGAAEAPTRGPTRRRRIGARDPLGRGPDRSSVTVATHSDGRLHGIRPLAGLEAREISAWFGDNLVLDRVSLSMAAGGVTALIGPSGCGKSTFLRILNRMHELIPGAKLAGEVLLDGADIYDPRRKLTDARRTIGMVFQKPNPFPAMSVYDNVLAGLRLTGTRADQATKDRLVEECLTKGGLWKEVRDRLRQPGGALSGGQQQRLCIARALAIRPRVLLMDEPCSALDPTSTRRIEETIHELMAEVTIVIVTHNMQQAARVSTSCAFFLAEQGTPGVIIEHGPTDAMFATPQDPRTADYVAGRFG
jgi:phosphate transport system ATP-binding protein